jgi:hypothetical protein
MKTKQLNVYREPPKEGVNNQYPTSENCWKQPALHLLVGQRTAGKSYLASKILAQCEKDKTFDVIYMITPSFNSNQAYFGSYVQPENVYEPTSDSITKVIGRVEADRDLWEKYLQDQKEYEKFKKTMKSDTFIGDDELLFFQGMGWLDDQRKEPVWKYTKEEPPKSCLILDDCLSSPAIVQSSGLTKVATLNRHIAPLKNTHSNRSACGLAVMILSQTYKMIGGLGRCLRENVSVLTLFKNRQEKQLLAIKEELANVVDLELFDKAYEYATSEKYGNLTIDFAPKDETKSFRKNLNEIIFF